jgi:MoaA/NifB/PqqE/SkfB family radical SAM enzyme
MNRIIKVEQESNSAFYLTWIINNICTNQCSYCSSDLYTGKNHNYDWDNARKFFDILFEKYGKVFCSIAGGEPSLSPFLPEIVKTFHDRGSGVNITTNGAKTVNYWETISPYISTISFSWHPQFVDPKFLQKVLAAGKNTRVSVKIMMYRDYWQQAVDAFNYYKNIQEINNITPVRIYDWGNNIDREAHEYEDYQLEWFDKNTSVFFKIPRQPYDDPSKNLKFYLDNDTIISKPNIANYINQGYTHFKNYTCEIGIKHLYVDWRGDVYRGNCLVGNRIGHIDSPESIQWPSGPIICDKDLCSCATDVIINKER